MSENPIPESSEPKIVNAASKPPGILPKNVQLWLMSGIALVMVLVIALSGDPASKEKSDGSPQLQRNVIDPNVQRIAEYRQRIEEQAQRLAAEQARLSQAKQGFLSGQPGDPGGAPIQTPPPYAQQSSYQPAEPTRASQPTQKGQIEAENEKREYLGRFSSNVALSYRTEGVANGYETTPASPQPATAPQSLAGVEPNQTEADTKPETEDRRPGKKTPAELTAADGESYRLFEGTVLETVLTNRLNGAFSGPVNCMITTNVYSRDRQQLLIPQGSRVLGEVRRVDTFGQQRLAVIFHRIVMPDGFSVNLDQFRGLNQIGETGLRDKVNNHYLQVFGVSVALGAIAGFSNYNTRTGNDSTGNDAYRQGFSASLSQSAVRILDRYLNILPTFVIREGHRIKIYLAGDLLLPAYNRHRLASDM